MNISNKLKILKLSDIKEYSKNAKIHSPEQIQAIKKSIEDHDYFSPIGVDKNNTIIFGHGRCKALKEIDPKQKIEVVDLSYLSAKQIKKLRILDNKIVSQDYDKELLQQEIESIYSNFQDDIDKIEKELSINEEELNDFKIKGDETKEENALAWNKLDIGKEVENEFKKISLKKYISNFKDIYINFSGGKDSLATLLWINENFPKKNKYLVYIDTGINFPEVKEYLMYIKKIINCKIIKLGLKNDKEYREKLKKNGMPSFMFQWCHRYLKANFFDKFYNALDAKNCIQVNGVRSSESNRRKKYIDRAIYNNLHIARPILNWTEEEVYCYIAKKKVKLIDTYKYLTRLSCFACPFQSAKKWNYLRKKRKNLFIKSIEYLILAMNDKKYKQEYILRDIQKMFSFNEELETNKLWDKYITKKANNVEIT